MKPPERGFWMNRRTFLRLGVAGAGTAALGGAAAKLESSYLEKTTKVIDGLGLATPVKVLHLSDFHASWCVPWKLIRESVEMGLEENPDLVVLTGDYVTSRKDDMSGYPDALAPLKGHPACFACFGNHDGGYQSENGSRAREIERLMGMAGVKFLFNRSEGIEIRGQKLRVAGLGDLWREEARPWECLGLMSEPRWPTLLLAHNPDTKQLLEEYGWDVMFCGHTHGGQVVVPFLRWKPVLPVADRSMTDGVYAWKGRKIHITRGVGNLHGVRFACRPEVSLLEIC